MKYKLIVVSLALLFVLAVAPVYGEDEGEVYYCADFDGNGFGFDKEKGSYQRMWFSSDRFKIKLDLPNKKIEMAHPVTGDITFTCTQPYSSIGKTSITCIHKFYMFNFNPDTGRYVYAMGFGYVASDNDSVSISIGKCDKF